MHTSFESFVTSLPPASRALLEDIALFVQRNSPANLSLTAVTALLSRTMPYLTHAEVEGLSYCATRSLQKENSQMIKLQMAMQRENLVFTSVSNVLRTRHDTAKNSIGNVY